MDEKQMMLPKASVRRIMKLSDDVASVSAEAIVCVSKLTEDFITKLLQDTYQVCADNNRKIVKLDDLLQVIANNNHQLEFLDGAFSPASK